MNEDDFARQVTDLATMYGWGWVHVRPARTAKGWRTPIQGPLGRGWPDLVLVRIRDLRIVFVELKASKGKVSLEQIAVMAELREAGAECHVWRPDDFDAIVEVLA